MEGKQANEQVFEIFPWNRNFETGIAVVDGQHRRLVEIINHLATHLGNRAEDVALEKVFADLAAYADYHFKTEEDLWEPCLGSDQAYLNHKRTHDSFMVKVEQLKAGERDRPLESVMKDILRFLTHWLAFHILGSDKHLAKVVQAVESGLPLDKAKQQADEEMNGSMQVLIEAVLSMYDQLSSRTFELIRERGESSDMAKALKASQQREKVFSDTLMASVPGLLYLFDDQLRLVPWNHRFSEMTGYSDAQLANKHLLDFFEDRYHEDVLRNVESYYERGYSEVEGRLVACDGHSIPFQFSALPMVVDGKRYFIGMGVDISLRKQAEKRLRMLSSSIEQAGEAILITDIKGAIQYVNPAFSRLTGYSEEEILGLNLSFLKSDMQDEDVYSQMWERILSGQNWQGRVVERRKDGSFYPAMLTISPIRNRAGRIEHFVGIQQDLSAYENLEQQFQQAQKMEAIGTLVGGIAHDFNNMLAGIMGNLYLVQSQLQNMPDLYMKLKGIEQLTFRAADMIQQLLTFARKDRVSMQRLPLVPFIKETVKFLRSSIPENIALNLSMENEAGNDAMRVNGDATQLHQVLLNLVNNARDALDTTQQPCIDIGLERLNTDSEQVAALGLPGVGEYARLSVSDNGEGVPAGNLPHLFEPFFTTKEPGKGTGLGLAMVFGAMQNHHGHVRATSTEGRGTRFDLYLPLLPQATGTAARKADPNPVEKGRGETILIVDDDSQVISVGAELLASLGYEVVTAGNGDKAVQAFEADRERIALVLMDVVMPRLGGIEAAELIRRIRPDIPVIFCSGYDGIGSIPEKLPESSTLITKPYSVPELSRTIRRMLAT